jgi:hypothetical protein
MWVEGKSWGNKRSEVKKKPLAKSQGPKIARALSL